MTNSGVNRDLHLSDQKVTWKKLVDEPTSVFSNPKRKHGLFVFKRVTQTHIKPNETCIRVYSIQCTCR